MKGPCRDSCIRDSASCWHKRTCKVTKQLRNGMWVLENSRGYIRLVDFTEMVFEEDEYEAHRNPNIFEFAKTHEKLNNHVLNNHKENTYIDYTSTVDHWCEEESVWHTSDHEPVMKGTRN